MKYKNVLKSVVGAAFLCLMFVQPVAGLEASFDTTFSTDGYDIIQSAEAAYDTVLQADGKLLVAGYNGTAFGESGAAVRRYNTDGSLDTSFSGNGLFAKDFSDIGGGNLFYGVAVQPNGKIVAVGHSYMDDGLGGFTKDSLIARINIDGTLDTTFSGDGYEIVDSFGDGAGDSDEFYDVVVKADGTIVAVGTDSVDGVARVYDSVGVLDTAYDTDGIIVTSGLAGGDKDIFNGVAIDATNKIVITGSSKDATGFSGRTDLIVIRYGTDGLLDTTFNTVGYYTEDGTIGTANSRDGGTEIRIIGGKIFVVGFSWTSGIRNLVWSFNDDGSPNTAFNSVGNLFVPDGSYIENIRPYSGGYILLGSTYDSGTNNTSLDLWLVKSDGTFDTTFGASGRMSFYPDYSFTEVWMDAYSLEIDGNKVYITGSPYDNKDFTSDMWFVGRVILGNTVQNIPSGTKLTDVSGQEITAPLSGVQSVVVTTASNTPIVEITHDFSSGDLDFSGVTVDSDAVAGTAVVSGLSGTHALYIPKLADANQVIICPDAVVISDVYVGCPNQETYVESDSNVTIVNINGQDYWRVDGLTGTGGMNSVSGDNVTLAETGTPVVYNLFVSVLVVGVTLQMKRKTSRVYSLKS